jgi:hypothetical protein
MDKNTEDTPNDFKEININGKIIQLHLKDGKINGDVKVIKEGKIINLHMTDNKIDGPMEVITDKKIFNVNKDNKVEITNIDKGIEVKKTTIEKLDKKINGKVIIQELRDGIDLSDAFFGNFVEGVLTGIFTKNNDKEEISGMFKDGKKDGIFNIVKKKTNAIWELNFINDKLDGKMLEKKNNELNKKVKKKNKVYKFLCDIKDGIINFIKKIVKIISKIVKFKI